MCVGKEGGGTQAGAGGSTAASDEALDVDAEEAFYEAHREELLQAMRADGPLRFQGNNDGGVGLMNQGATCYMNSLLQSLFYTPEFRHMLFRFRHDPAAHGPEASSIPFQLQQLFAKLRLSQASALSTRALTDACGFSSRQTSEQHDVQELCRVLFDALEQSSVFMKEEIHRLFAGRVKYWIRTREEHAGRVYESARTEQYMDLQVHIQGHAGLEESLRAMLEAEVLDGDNRWNCEQLGEKVAALKGMSFESVPEILCIQLMRFVFDYQTLRRKKLTDSFSCPLGLDLSFLLEGSKGPMHYKLTGVCLHSGTAHGGHYHAFTLDPYTEVWRDCNDSSVHVLGPEQTENLFKRRDGFEGASKTPVPLDRAFYSSDAYFLIYRRAERPVPQDVDDELPASIREQLVADNSRLKILQRAYVYHRKLRELKIFCPLVARLALRRYAAQRLDGTLPSVGGESLGEATEEEAKHVSISVSEYRSVGDVLRRARARLASEAAKGETGWSWALGLDGSDWDGRVRLRRYQQGAWGEVAAPLDEGATIGAALGSPGFGGASQLLVELRASTQEPWEAYGAGDANAIVVILCRFNREQSSPSVADGDVIALRVVAAGIPDAGTSPTEASTAAVAVTATQNEAPAAVYDPDDMPDLFAAPTVPPPRPAAGGAGSRCTVRDFRKQAAKAFGLELDRAAFVVLHGSSAGALGDDAKTLDDFGLYRGDVVCVEELEQPGDKSQCLALYTERQDTVRVSFNHPDRPEYPEECGPVAISKDSTIGELKARIAEELGLNAAELHLCHQHKSAQLKDESRTLRALGMKLSQDTVHVGHGAPCAPDESMLRISLYVREKEGYKARDAFSMAAKSSSSVRNLREALVEPLAKWGAEVSASATGGESGDGGGGPPFPMEDLAWRRLRLRDGQAGKQFAILRDERTLRSALMGLGDGRQVAVQVLDADEELRPDDAIIAVRPWRVLEVKLHAPTELVIDRTQSLGDFRDMLTKRFHGLLQQTSSALAQADKGATDAAQNSGDTAVAANVGAEEDSLEIVTVPTHVPPLTLNRCESLKWGESRLNASDAEALAKPLSEYKEVRDGVTIIVRSKLAAAQGRPKPSGAAPPPAKPKGAPARPLPKGAPKAAATIGPAAPRPGWPAGGGERGLVIRVAHPEAAPTQSEASET